MFKLILIILLSFVTNILCSAQSNTGHLIVNLKEVNYKYPWDDFMEDSFSTKLFKIDSINEFEGITIDKVISKIIQKYPLLGDRYFEQQTEFKSEFVNGAEYYFKLNSDSILVFQTIFHIDLTIKSRGLKSDREYFNKQNQFNGFFYTRVVKDEILFLINYLQKYKLVDLETLTIWNVIQKGFPNYKSEIDSLIKKFPEILNSD